MVEKYQAWRASDGSLHDTEQSAKDHEFHGGLAAWFRERFPNPGTDVEPGMHFCQAVFEDRMKLLPIFKLLNGGSPISAPTPMPERPSGEVIELPR